MKQVNIRRPDDWHLHLRRGDMMRNVLPASERSFARALVMPNTSPNDIRSAVDAATYRGEIKEASRNGLTPLMTIKLLESTSQYEIAACKNAGVIAGKLYPQGVTTNSDNGPSDLKKLYPVFSEMERVGMVLCLHGEAPDASLDCLDREKLFLDSLIHIVETFPKLRVVLEHVTTAEAVEMVKELPDTVAATITVHHLFLSLNDVIDKKIRPHNYCLPVAKPLWHRQALRYAVLSANPKFFLGTDSAPHLRTAKECSEGCAGIFTAPVAMPLIAQFFDEHGMLDWIQPFCSEFGARFYGLPLNEGKLTLVREPMRVPEEIHGIVPFMAGKTLPWRVE